MDFNLRPAIGDKALPALHLADRKRINRNVERSQQTVDQLSIHYAQPPNTHYATDVA